MAFRDFKEHFMEQAKKAGFFNRESGNQRGAMPNGGTTGYYPDNKARDLFATQDIPVQQVQQANQSMGTQQAEFHQPVQQPVTPPQGKDPVSQFTSGFGGFQQSNTGYQPNANAQPQQNVWQSNTGYQPNAQAQQNTGYQQNAWQNNTGYQQNANAQPQQNTGYQQNTWQNNTGYQQNVNAQPPQSTGHHQTWQQSTGYQQNVNAQAQQNTGYQQNWQNNTGYQQKWQHTGYQANAAQPQQNAQHVQTPQQRAMGFDQEAETPKQSRAAKRQQRAQQVQQPNIVYMPNSGTGFVDESGKAYAHVERIVQVVSVAACFRVMEFMRNGESIIINTESIANEADVQRCLDLLAGAAFTMGSSMTKITQLKRTYLIAPQTVLVMADATVGSWAERDGAREQYDTEQPEQFRPVRGAYVPDRPDEQRRDMYQAQQERAMNGFTGQQRSYAQTYR